MKKTSRKKDFIYVVFLMIFVVSLGTGITFMQYGMANPNINLGLTIVGLIGTAIFGVIFTKK